MLDVRETEGMRMTGWIGAAGAAVTALLIAVNPLAHDHADHPLAHLDGHAHSVLADDLTLHERETAQNARRALSLGLFAPTFSTAEEEHEHHMIDSPLASPKPDRKS